MRDWEAEGSFDERIENVEAAIDSLLEALDGNDESGAVLAGAQLRRALDVAERSAIAIGVTDVERHPEVAAALLAVQSEAMPLLERVPVRLYGYASVRRFLARFKLDL
ncbi:MAG: hypothetical protein HOV81_29310 [Kofleriaceae bacterium]|nr:hypothetical protein [Kofleriaceae bacterium]